jgi:hypothetical protein
MRKPWQEVGHGVQIWSRKEENQPLHGLPVFHPGGAKAGFALVAVESVSDPHGHDDVAVLVVIDAGGAELAGGLGVLELDVDLVALGGLEEL